MDDQSQPIDASEIKNLPLNVRLDVASFNVAQALGSIQHTCDIDDATMSLVVDAYLSAMRRGLNAAAAMQYVEVKALKKEPVHSDTE